VPSATLPPIKIWKEKNPLGYARLTHARLQLATLSQTLQIPVENLITPELVKRVCWQNPPSASSEYEGFVKDELEKMGARPWQIEQVTSIIAPCLSEIEPVLIPEPVEVESEPEAAGP